MASSSGILTKTPRGGLSSVFRVQGLGFRVQGAETHRCVLVRYLNEGIRLPEAVSFTGDAHDTRRCFGWTPGVCAAESHVENLSRIYEY